jgi:hypothetical protein
MKTDELIGALATGLTPVRRGEAAARLAWRAAAGGLVSAALLLAVLGARPDLLPTLAVPGFWMKWAFTLAFAAAAFAAALRLGRPEARMGGFWLIVALPPLAIGALAVLELAGAPAELRPQLLFGSTWQRCLFFVAGLSLPVLIGALSALRHLAPTRLGLAGFQAGLLAGSVSASVYVLHCPESTAAFLATWYTLGILAAGGAGAMAGRVLLRW